MQSRRTFMKLAGTFGIGGMMPFNNLFQQHSTNPSMNTPSK